MVVNRRVAIIGSGLVGRSWAVVIAGGGFDVDVFDDRIARRVAIRRVLEDADVKFIDRGKGGGPVVRLRVPSQGLPGYTFERAPRGFDIKRNVTIVGGGGAKGAPPRPQGPSYFRPSARGRWGELDHA